MPVKTDSQVSAAARMNSGEPQVYHFRRTAFAKQALTRGQSVVPTNRASKVLFGLTSLIVCLEFACFMNFRAMRLLVHYKK